MHDDSQRGRAPESAGTGADERREWSPPELRRIDLGSTAGSSAKFPGTSEVPTFYNSPPVC